MTDISSIGVASYRRVERAPEAPERAAAPARETAPARADADRVEVSDMARFLSKLKELPEVRQDVVDRVRREIAAGTYDTPERLDAALDGLLQDLDTI